MNDSRADFAILPGTMTVDGTPVQEFARIVAGMNRFLIRLSRIPLFKDAELGLTEWIALSVLHRSEGINNKKLASQLGVTRQRAHQIVNKLESAKLISVEVSSLDSRENIILLAENGERQLQALNKELSSLLEATLGAQSEQLPRLRRQIMRLRKVVRGPRPEGEAKMPRVPAPHERKGLFGLLGKGRAALGRWA